MSLNRRQFITLPALAALPRTDRPLAITMWDFSWLERRWPGAGYEDWTSPRRTQSPRLRRRPHRRLPPLHPLRRRPHLELPPEWSVQDWGAASRCRVRVQPELNQFIAKFGDRGLKVGLSSWFRQDIHDHRMRLSTPEQLGAAWKTTLDSIAAAGLLKHIYYVDLCNEFPLDVWAPYVPNLSRATEGVRWMAEPIALLKRHYPDLAYTFSFTSEYQTWEKQDVSMLDFLELHLWMTHYSDFYEKVGYRYERFDTKGYDNLALNAEATYRKDPAHWQSRLKYGIDQLEAWSIKSGKPLITTECWSLVDYKDSPLLNWNWIKDLCDLGVRYASSKGRWAAIATSNFCGPQFKGMWRDVEWHRRLTDVIHSGRMPG